MDITLRDVRDDDLDVFFRQGADVEANRMAAFTSEDPSDRGRFDAHWARVRADRAVVLRSVVGPDGELLGHVAVYGPPEEREVTYWFGRECWGRGVATAALRALLAEVVHRPLYARVAADNAGSVRVLGKCGFVVTGRDKDFAYGRGEEIEELILKLDR
ncbi:GNAT family N-acetyltransferase [Streptomyces uncialis]|uniref:GNAT family N-acetyltransferase n=1 Tax=Streptomyces uncialis TaxID=1048205 RepID=UPI0033D34B2B